MARDCLEGRSRVLASQGTACASRPAMTRLPFHATTLLAVVVLGCANPAYEPAPPLPPPPSPGIFRTAEEEWGPWEGDASMPEQAPPASEPLATARPQEPVNPGEAPWKKEGGPLPPLPNQGPKYGPMDPPPVETWVRPYSSGQWVYTSEYGWIWVPSGASASTMDGVPYTYLYTPRFGWTWYISPWGFGPYSYGAWVTHPWRPIGWHPRPWVAHPRVTIRLGGSHHHRR